MLNVPMHTTDHPLWLQQCILASFWYAVFPSWSGRECWSPGNEDHLANIHQRTLPSQSCHGTEAALHGSGTALTTAGTCGGRSGRKMLVGYSTGVEVGSLLLGAGTGLVPLTLSLLWPLTVETVLESWIQMKYICIHTCIVSIWLLFKLDITLLMFPALSLKFCWILSPHDVSETMQVVEDLVPQVLHGMA